MTDSLKINVKMRGFYRCVLNPETSREIDTGWFPNLITDSGLDRIGSTAPSPGVFTWASVGTGTTAPANSDTGLQAFVASTSSIIVDSQSNGGASAYVAQCQFHHTYNLGAVVGNMAEVGLGWANGGGNLWSRARILDGAGSPTTLTVTSADQLVVYYKLTCTPVITDITGTLTLSGTGYPYTGRLANAASFGASLYSEILGSQGNWARLGDPTVRSYPSTSSMGAITSTPSGTDAAGTGTFVTGTYTNGNKYLDSTITLPPTHGNASGGIGGMLIFFSGGLMAFQYIFSTPIPKDNLKTMTFGVRFSWDR